VKTLSKAARACWPALGAAGLVWLSGCSGASHAEPSSDGVGVTPSGAVRQGQTGVVLSFNRAAGGLSKPSRVDLEDLQVEIDARSSDEQLLLNVSVPHGAALGPRTLTIDTPAGTLTQADALEVAPITVSPSGVDGALGTPSSPFRSLQQALLVAGAGDTCLLKNGTYDQASGETWGYAAPDQLSVMGESAAQTILQGPERDLPRAPGPASPPLLRAGIKRSISPVSKRPARTSGSASNPRRKPTLVVTPRMVVSRSAASRRRSAVGRSGPQAATLASIGS